VSPKNNDARNARPPTRSTKILGTTFFGKKLWVSELTSIIFICVLSAFLLYISVIILRNERTINDLDHKIIVLKAEKVDMTHEMEIASERLRVKMLLGKAAGKKIKPETIDKLADLVYQSSKQYGYSPEMLLAVMAVESQFNPNALGRFRSGNLSGALGLMQVKYEAGLWVAKKIGMEGLKEEDLMDPEINMILGTTFLTMMIARFKNFQHGVMAYNLGPGTVRGTLARREQLPMGYYQKVLTQYHRLKTLGDELEMVEAMMDVEEDYAESAF
jgi:soluble lytic murein transglycosylase